MRAIKNDLTGRSFGKWVVKGVSNRKKEGVKFWDCVCACGFEQQIPRWTLEKGLSNSCLSCKPKLEKCARGHETTDWGRDKSHSCRGCIKHRNLLREYGITLEEFEQLWNYQEGKCAICKLPIALYSKGAPGWHFSERRPEVDHEHGLSTTSKKDSVRGILCGGQWAGCNRKLGKIDDIKWLRAVLEYVENPPARKLWST
jgi:Recombination endonuclease VII